ncbi:MAG: hypothetical protein ABIP51_06270 [Bacteroidia bacterium]
MSKDEYVAYLNSTEGGLINSKEFNGKLFKVKLQTPEIIFLSNYEDSILDEEKLKKGLPGFNDKVNFIIILEDVPGNNEVKQAVVNKDSYSKILSYGNTEMKNDFKLIQGNDTNYCSLALIEPANSLQPVIRIAISFSGLNALNKNNLTLIYNDRIFEQGPVKFNYTKTVFENIPALKL